MAIIASWFNDRYQTKEVDLIVEDTLLRLKQRDGLLDKYFPLKNYDSRNFLGYVVEKIRVLASVISVGGIIPATQQGNIRQVTSQLVKIALSHVWDEKTQWDVSEAMTLAKARRVSLQDRVTDTGTVIKGSNQTIADYLFGKPEDLVQAVIDLLDFFTWQVITTGQVNYTDSRDNTVTTLDWRVPGATYNHFPAALSNTNDTVNPGSNIWTSFDYANGIFTIEDAVETFRETNGYDPKAVVMSKIARKNLYRQKGVVDMARTVVYSGMDDSKMSPSVLNKVMENRELPPIVTYDEQFYVEDSAGVLAKGRFFPTNRFAFLTDGMGERAMGVTMESKKSLDDTPKSGIYVNTYEKSKSPVLDVTEAIASALPIALNPKLLYSQQISA